MTDAEWISTEYDDSACQWVGCDGYPNAPLEEVEVLTVTGEIVIAEYRIERCGDEMCECIIFQCWQTDDGRRLEWDDVTHWRSTKDSENDT
jgi:hypothetical protein